MPKVSKAHPYSDQKSFERLLILITALIRFPGVGCPDVDGMGHRAGHHNALAAVQEKWQAIARELNIDCKPNYPSLATIRKDFSFLRQYGVLENRMYRWGYYLGTGVFSAADLQLALNGMGAIAHDLGDFRYRQALEKIQRYLRGFDFKDLDPTYPIRQNLNHPVNQTDPELMMAQGEYRHTLFHHLPDLEAAIWKGQKIEISRHSSPYTEKYLGLQQVWPLQLIFYHVAWYLLYEDCQTGCLVVGRLNRFAEHFRIIDPQGRGLNKQRERLAIAHQLLEQGWGLRLGTAEEQQAELQGTAELIPVKVRFFDGAAMIALEAEQRHPSQQIRKGPKASRGYQPKYIDYSVTLPRRSIPEFMQWLRRYGHNIQILTPDFLIKQHYQQAQKILKRYELETSTHKKHDVRADL
ncbi:MULTISPECIES: YafY family protein [Cyanophyceae]|uniref:helix-turn-helix transcriptional regulator n=1 Tax=Cyanophyceae TaxID=3028117 RepID=UPI00016DCED4|nr:MULTISPECIES: WYL domain-containing protein [Cyanophyceae]ACB00987.1 hypothetical protein, putative [Picosynechococcus sp. PCC 7002]SMH58434.1 Predicted DNA-binding transcriptional regulator YafY, contains an HTH and WYL domains [Picosynechococcus sp. OG1]SMQ86429.1 Predicted DNA-binding transcriptional regulator YafY, contains an HTH and WYL domains [Synechococcus sp. 7002]